MAIAIQLGRAAQRLRLEESPLTDQVRDLALAVGLDTIGKAKQEHRDGPPVVAIPFDRVRARIIEPVHASPCHESQEVP